MSVSTFQLKNDYISPTNIISDWSLICAAWMRIDSDTVHSVDISGHIDDKETVLKLRNELAKADLLIGHNADKFDIRKLNARLIFHNLEPLPPMRTLDTLREAKKIAAFTSNKLNYLGQYFGVGRKIHTDASLWIDILLNKDKDKRIKEMVTYCKQDVRLLKDVYLRLKPYIKNHPSLYDKVGLNCVVCNGTNLHKKGLLRTQSKLWQRWLCTDCGSYSKTNNETTNKTTINEQR